MILVKHITTRGNQSHEDAVNSALRDIEKTCYVSSIQHAVCYQEGINVATGKYNEPLYSTVIMYRDDAHD